MSADTFAVGTEPLLTSEEVDVLARRIEAGVLARAARVDPARSWGGSATAHELAWLEAEGEQARQRFIAANLRLVALVARSFGSGEAGSADLFQEGCLGLISAVERFDHRRGVRFSTYALFWIRAAVGAAAARQVGAVQLPTSRAEQVRAVRGHESGLVQRLGRPATVPEVASSLGRSERWTAKVLAHRRPQSLDALEADARDQATAVRAQDAPDVGWARNLLDDLSAEQRAVVELRFGFTDGRARSLADVGRSLRQPVSRVRRVERQALEQLRATCPRAARDEL